jgi:two-component system nitrogen regulation response regulator NtrX
VIAATNRAIEDEVRAGRFREDLWFRLAVIPIRVPPLRERGEDVVLLARHFLERFRLENNRPPMTFAKGADAMLAARAWPGNVRELQNAVERLAIMGRGAEIGAADLEGAGLGAADGTRAVARPGTSPAAVGAAGGLVEARRRFEIDCIRRALAESDGNVSRAARALGIDRTNLHKKIQAYGLETKEAPGEGDES